jgi:hypothetical protein
MVRTENGAVLQRGPGTRQEPSPEPLCSRSLPGVKIWKNFKPLVILFEKERMQMH